MFEPASEKKQPTLQTMSLQELQQELDRVKRELVSLGKGFVPKHLCASTIQAYKAQQQAIEVEMESRSTGASPSLHG